MGHHVNVFFSLSIHASNTYLLGLDALNQNTVKKGDNVLKLGGRLYDKEWLVYRIDSFT